VVEHFDDQPDVFRAAGNDDAVRSGLEGGHEWIPSCGSFFVNSQFTGHWGSQVSQRKVLSIGRNGSVVLQRKGSWVIDALRGAFACQAVPPTASGD
jgi:hypothetical protein